MTFAKQKWDKIYSARLAKAERSQPAEVLSWHQHLLPDAGVALDLACGLGANSLLLAKSGLTVCSWDISTVAIEHINQLAAEQKLTIEAVERNVLIQPPLPETLDVLVVTYFLARELTPTLIAALKPGGLLFYQTYCQNKVSDVGPSNTDFLLERNELLWLFSGLIVCAYREDDCLGNDHLGLRNQAMLVGQKN